MKTIAHMRRWAYDGIEPKKVFNEKTRRWVWPPKMKFLPVTVGKCFEDDVPLVATPIDMILHCPKCHLQHVDAPHGEWTNPPHRTHLCHGCGNLWRPANVQTNGVEQLEVQQ